MKITTLEEALDFLVSSPEKVEADRTIQENFIHLTNAMESNSTIQKMVEYHIQNLPPLEDRRAVLIFVAGLVNTYFSLGYWFAGSNQFESGIAPFEEFLENLDFEDE